MNDHQSEKEHFLFSCLGTPRHWALGMAGFGWKMRKLCAQGGWTGPESWGPTGRPGSKPCFPAEFPVNSIEPPQGKPLLVVHIVRAWRSAGIHMSLEVRQSRETVGGCLILCHLLSGLAKWRCETEFWDDFRWSSQANMPLPDETSTLIIIPSVGPHFFQGRYYTSRISWDVHKEFRNPWDPTGFCFPSPPWIPWIVPGASRIPSQAALNLRCNGPAARFFATHPFWMAYPLVMADIAIENGHY